MSICCFSHSSRQTKLLGKILGKEILKAQPQQNSALIIGLKGDLGSGKTIFAQGLAKGLGIKEKILSPTFVILKKFQVSSFRFQAFYHIDCYRIREPKEILKIGFQEIVADPKNIVAIEWAEKIKSILPKNCPMVRFDFIGKTKRKITLKNFQFSINFQWFNFQTSPCFCIKTLLN
jgi:tRNA threonylcarbamoyladenosine biosynthesis protein TsaE